MKRVWCLYRVSTEKQLYKDDKGEADIPTQKRACYKFIKSKPDWEITKEISAMGISGWKTKTEDRDDLLEIKQGAEKKKFDILLVFMFDRIGRREDETPFVVEFLVNHGIEVWSVQEGQQEIKTHTDKLMNYIRFWNSSGESLKISERVRNAYETLNEQGRYISGQPPYGYEKYDTEIPHPKIKNKTLLGLRVNPDEVDLVKTIFDLYVNKGLGGIRLSEYLNTETTFKRRNEKPFTGEQINKIIRNPIYIGRKAYNKEDKPVSEWKVQDYNLEWHIVDEDIWNKAQVLADKRRNKVKHDPLPTHSQLLFSGLAFCSYCGAKLSVSHSFRQYTIKSGEIRKQVMKRYSCQNAKYKHYKDQHECTMFGGKTFDQETESIIRGIMKKLSEISLADKIDEFVKEGTKEKAKDLKKLQRKQKEITSEYEALKKELPKVLLGKSKFSESMISELIDEKEKELNEMNIRISQLEEKVNDYNDEIAEIIETQKISYDWDKLYDKADRDEKKMMISKVVEKIYFGKNKIEIEFNPIVKKIFEQF